MTKFILLCVALVSLCTVTTVSAEGSRNRESGDGYYCAGNYVYNSQGKQLSYASSCKSVVFERQSELFCAGNYVYTVEGRQLAYTSSCEDVVFSRRNRLFCAGNYLYTFEGQQRQYVSSCKEIKF